MNRRSGQSDRSIDPHHALDRALSGQFKPRPRPFSYVPSSDQRPLMRLYNLATISGTNADPRHYTVSGVARAMETGTVDRDVSTMAVPVITLPAAAALKRFNLSSGALGHRYHRGRSDVNVETFGASD